VQQPVAQLLGSAVARAPSRSSSRVQASRLQARLTSSTQTVLTLSCRDGRWAKPVFLAQRIRSSTRCRASRWASCPTSVSVAKVSEPPAVGVGEGELRSGMGAFPADDDPHPGRPVGGGQVAERAGQFGDVGTVAEFSG